jgi:hypothetical protein
VTARIKSTAYIDSWGDGEIGFKLRRDQAKNVDAGAQGITANKRMAEITASIGAKL